MHHSAICETKPAEERPISYLEAIHFFSRLNLHATTAPFAAIEFTTNLIQGTFVLHSEIYNKYFTMNTTTVLSCANCLIRDELDLQEEWRRQVTYTTYALKSVRKRGYLSRATGICRVFLSSLP